VPKLKKAYKQKLRRLIKANFEEWAGQGVDTSGHEAGVKKLGRQSKKIQDIKRENRRLNEKCLASSLQRKDENFVRST
jgi:hypothetical protein